MLWQYQNIQGVMGLHFLLCQPKIHGLYCRIRGRWSLPCSSTLKGKYNGSHNGRCLGYLCFLCRLDRYGLLFLKQLYWFWSLGCSHFRKARARIMEVKGIFIVSIVCPHHENNFNSGWKSGARSSLGGGSQRACLRHRLVQTQWQRYRSVRVYPTKNRWAFIREFYAFLSVNLKQLLFTSFLASASEDCTVKVWQIPDGGITRTMTECVVDLVFHQRRVGIVLWHPSAQNILLSAGSDNNVCIWNVGTGECLINFQLPELVLSACWNWDGSEVRVATKIL